jgi:hypothetical protein
MAEEARHFRVPTLPAPTVHRGQSRPLGFTGAREPERTFWPRAVDPMSPSDSRSCERNRMKDWRNGSSPMPAPFGPSGRAVGNALACPEFGVLCKYSIRTGGADGPVAKGRVVPGSASRAGGNAAWVELKQPGNLSGGSPATCQQPEKLP